MNKLLLGMLAFSVLLFSSCSEDEEMVNEVAPMTVTFTAAIEGDNSSSRTMVDNGTVTWSAGDAISVLNSNKGFTTCSLTSGAGTHTGKFTGIFPNGATPGNLAIYPAGSHSSDGENLIVNLPEEYGDTDTPYTPNANVLMLGKKRGDNELYFKHLGGGLRVSIDVPVGATSVSLTAKGICGNFVVDTSGEDALIAQPDNAQEQTVTYKFKKVTTEETKMFYFPLPTGKYEKFAITVAAKDGSATKTINYGTGRELTRTVMATLPNLINLELHEWVDLGIGILFAKTNVGTANESGCGDYYGWAETLPKTDPANTSGYSWTTYKYSTGFNGFTKYNTLSNKGKVDNKTTLEAMDDVATVNWGNKWRMPTNAEVITLCTSNLITREWVDNYNGTGANGFLVKGKGDKAGASIFLPAAGTLLSSTGVVDQSEIGVSGHYWSSSLNTTTTFSAYSMQISKSKLESYGNLSRWGALPIRPVRKNTN